jgi:hypothetical protein
VVNKYDVQVLPGHFDFPVSERPPSGYPGHVDIYAKMISLQLDDAWRLGMITLIMGVLLPYVVTYLFSSKYRTALRLHQFGAVMYFFDIWRRHTHPHSWVLNTPFFVMWVGDLVIGRLWRRDSTADSHGFRLSDDYYALFWKKAKRGKENMCETVGPTYHMKVCAGNSI